jgi:hypothetical protein
MSLDHGAIAGAGSAYFIARAERSTGSTGSIRRLGTPPPSHCSLPIGDHRDTSVATALLRAPAVHASLSPTFVR